MVLKLGVMGETVPSVVQFLLPGAETCTIHLIRDNEKSCRVISLSGTIVHLNGSSNTKCCCGLAFRWAGGLSFNPRFTPANLVLMCSWATCRTCVSVWGHVCEWLLPLMSRWHPASCWMCLWMGEGRCVARSSNSVMWTQPMRCGCNGSHYAESCSILHM